MAFSTNNQVEDANPVSIFTDQCVTEQFVCQEKETDKKETENAADDIAGHDIIESSSEDDLQTGESLLNHYQKVTYRLVSHY